MSFLINGERGSNEKDEKGWKGFVGDGMPNSLGQIFRGGEETGGS